MNTPTPETSFFCLILFCWCAKKAGSNWRHKLRLFRNLFYLWGLDYRCFRLAQGVEQNMLNRWNRDEKKFEMIPLQTGSAPLPLFCNESKKNLPQKDKQRPSCYTKIGNCQKWWQYVTRWHRPSLASPRTNLLCQDRIMLTSPRKTRRDPVSGAKIESTRVSASKWQPISSMSHLVRASRATNSLSNVPQDVHQLQNFRLFAIGFVRATQQLGVWQRIAH